MKKSAIFFDRDGIVIKPIDSEAPTDPKQLKIFPEIIPVIKRARELNYLIFIVSNQPDIALGLINEETKNKLEEKFIKLLKAKGIVMDEIYYCHHHPNGRNPRYAKKCDCQKPKPGMLLNAIKRFNIDPKNSFMIGDRASDIKAGESAKVKTILFDPDKTQTEYLNFHQVKPDFKTNSLSKISEIIAGKMAFVLAAGRGSRMLPLTKKIPKPLLKINGKPMIEYVLKLLEFHQFNKIAVNLFHLKTSLKKYLEKSNVQIIEEKSLSGSAGGVKAIGNILKPTQPFLVVASDMLINFDLSKIYQFHMAHKSLATICCYFRPKSKLNIKKSGQIYFDKKTKQVLKFLERPEGNKIISQWVNSSIYVFSPEILEYIPAKSITDIANDLIPNLLQLKKSVFAYPINHKRFYQLGIDTPERVKIAEEDIKSGKFLPTA